jgi:CheY-like chemotaxis protein
MLEPIFKSKSFCLILSNLQSAEKKLLEFSLESEGADVQYWDPYFGNPSFNPGQIFLTNYSKYCLHTWKEWAIPTSIIGRLSEEEKSRAREAYLTSFWDLEKNSLSFYLPYINNQYISTPRTALIWTEDKSFNETLRSMLSFFQIQCIIASGSEYAIASLKSNRYDLVFLDWDNCGMEPLILIREFRKMRQLMQYLPEFIGIKDFNKMNIFKDLTSGIREFCSVLFTPKEVIELLLRSLPLESNHTPQSYMDTELPVLLPSTLKEPNGKLYLDYKKENRLASLKTQHSIQEFKILSYKSQFDWLLF